MPNFLSTQSNTTDAADIIPARLGTAAMAAVFVGTGGMMIIPIIELPSWIPVSIEGQIIAEPEAESVEPLVGKHIKESARAIKGLFRPKARQE